MLRSGSIVFTVCRGASPPARSCDLLNVPDAVYRLRSGSGPDESRRQEIAMTDLALVEDRKTRVLADLILRDFQRPREVLVVGCGSGAEAGALARYLRAETTGIDISPAEFDRERAAPAQLKQMDAEALEFPEATFDLVFSFHSLEHMAHPDQALTEMRRVLQERGTYIVGTPNSQRLLGYVGSPVSLRTKIAWNIHDLRVRAQGEWSNEQGAHAGFSRRELLSLCSEVFRSAEDISDEYYSRLYPKFDRGLRLIRAGRMAHRVYPSVYIAGCR